MTKIDWCGKLLKNSNNIYFPINKLGYGSYASVWMCYHKNKKQLLAIKIFKPIDDSKVKLK
jgi:serine/threonine protein kinase